MSDVPLISLIIEDLHLVHHSPILVGCLAWFKISILAAACRSAMEDCDAGTAALRWLIGAEPGIPDSHLAWRGMGFFPPFPRCLR